MAQTVPHLSALVCPKGPCITVWGAQKFRTTPRWYLFCTACIAVGRQEITFQQRPSPHFLLHLSGPIPVITRPMDPGLSRTAFRSPSDIPKASRTAWPLICTTIL